MLDARLQQLHNLRFRYQESTAKLHIATGERDAPRVTDYEIRRLDDNIWFHEAYKAGNARKPHPNR